MGRWLATALLLLAASVARADDAYVPPAGSQPALHIGGYLDAGFAKAQGDGTSWAPNLDQLPLDYAADTFAPEVDSRGDVASTDSHGRFTNGFLPHSMGIGGKPSFFISTFDLDLRYEPESSHYMAFARLQFLPRVDPLDVESDKFLVEQAFVRVVPFDSQELALTVGKFDSVFGIEYLENEANIRTGVTPSLLARYTTGWETGAKLFYRYQIPSLWSAFSINTALTTNTPLIDSLQPSAISLTGVPVWSFRLGYELNLPKVLVKVGLSHAEGPRSDQTDPNVAHIEQGLDFRLETGWISFSIEGVRVDMREGGADKVGTATLVSAFLVEGFTTQLAVAIPIDHAVFRRLTPYVRYDRRVGGFTNFERLDTDRRTFGARLDLGDMQAALKAEYLWNVENSGAANVANDVFTTSLVVPF